jgi:glycerol-3-phosphate dehydrogenase (NAD(P)+)
MSRIAVIGAGAWGTALAVSLAHNPAHELALWAHSADHAAELSRTGESRRYLPGFVLPSSVHVTADLPEAIQDTQTILFAVPSQTMRATARQMAPGLRTEQVLVSASKGIEEKTFLRMSQVLAECAPGNPIAVLGGPSFAQEVAAGMPTALTVATGDEAVGRSLQEDFSSPSLRVYRNDDVTGVELGGALKNVIALAAGVVTGLQLGHNAAAALITRGIAEMTRLAVACGGRRDTLAGLSGVGSLSRNRAVGIELGRGKKLQDIIASLDGKVAEGVKSTQAALGLAGRYGVEMPITAQMAAVLHQNKSPQDAIRELMTRPGRIE